MINGVIDRQGKEWKIEQAIENSVEIGFPKSFIRAAVRFGQRDWSGKAHPTDIINCPRQAALKYTTDYPIILDRTVDAMIGTSMHRFFENGENSYANVRVSNELITGEMDLLEIVNGEGIIYDFKVVKSFPVKKALGFYKEDEPILDEDGNVVLLKSGPRKGEVKTRSVTKQDLAHRDVVTYTRQLNMYRYLFETGDDIEPNVLQKSYIIEGLIVMQLLKEAGRTAAQNGIIHSSYAVPIPIVSNKNVATFIQDRAVPINDFMRGGELPGIPDCPQDVWEGRLCRDYCPVKDFCAKYGNNQYL